MSSACAHLWKVCGTPCAVFSRCAEWCAERCADTLKSCAERCVLKGAESCAELYRKVCRKACMSLHKDSSYGSPLLLLWDSMNLYQYWTVKSIFALNHVAVSTEGRFLQGEGSTPAPEYFWDLVWKCSFFLFVLFYSTSARQHTLRVIVLRS